MGTEDKFLKEQFGNKRPFKVPDGYFENLASQIMEKLPERDVKVAQKQKKSSVWRIYRYVAVAGGNRYRFAPETLEAYGRRSRFAGNCPCGAGSDKRTS